MTRLIVSNRSALIAKYAKAGLVKIEAAVAAMIAADKARGIKSRLIYLDHGRGMKKLKGKAGDCRLQCPAEQARQSMRFSKPPLRVPHDPGRAGRDPASGPQESDVQKR
jgi:hypothetical protein